MQEPKPGSNSGRGGAHANGGGREGSSYSGSSDRPKVSLMCENWVLTNTNQSSSETKRGNIVGNKIKVEVR